MEIRFTQSARRHKIGRARVRHVITTTSVVIAAPSPQPGGVDRLVFLGDDHTGRALEVIVVPLDGGALLVIHAMDLRDKYRHAYEAGLS